MRHSYTIKCIYMWLSWYPVDFIFYLVGCSKRQRAKMNREVQKKETGTCIRRSVSRALTTIVIHISAGGRLWTQNFMIVSAFVEYVTLVRAYLRGIDPLLWLMVTFHSRGGFHPGRGLAQCLLSFRGLCSDVARQTEEMWWREYSH